MARSIISQPYHKSDGMSTSLNFFFSHFALVSEREDTIHIGSLPAREPHISYNGEMSGGFLIHLTDGRRRRRPHDTIHPLIRSAVQFRENLVGACAVEERG